ncbi:2-succinyl-5-enolpyruvyl-6-hydroxy-3-cyclohexene-1-carboxylic-acid synthase [Vagococcus hydrophili]|uniref:2-succinyl-5-enolpyruvyl-6-hydroxy-3-cyclohexene-1-carboxylate synthase n=1 Tax=Vagococcus hydrophili TaxID=2714947 RepID=A0A6G8AW72_9ENTE|nr:2-succinyl-5-enolpyruvyl-6-hydroxy-3-cyclohexene-1-carboxylic-acid synthase [Vagococcus hydrophili]QIL49246.1 2-succinyl-5-enolpyruvyl-6-hydroxy-3-cyclohexene-1-carboxylic-acid synthase [Vagococcus hydrophili]
MSDTMTKFLKASIEGFKDSGVVDVVLSPGSRSTPLALLFENDEDFKVYMDVDERSASFFALGLSKTKKKPVVCVCTSGTAAANYFPAICEAKESQIPLIILTTDRPQELRHVGAPQTMEQVHLYGDKVKFSMEFPVAEETPRMLQYSYAQTFQLVSRAESIPMGPVHANFPFREPLIPNLEVETPVLKRKQRVKGIKVVQEFPKTLKEGFNEEKGIFLLGETTELVDVEKLVALAEKLGWPIFSDSLANLKTSGVKSSVIINHHDLLMKHLELKEDLQPKVIIRLGRALLSKDTNLFLQNFEGHYYIVDDTGLIQDYSHQCDLVIESNKNAFIEASLCQVEELAPNNWLKQWKELDEKVSQILHQTNLLTDYSETRITADILNNLPNKSQLFISNSMPIRDTDTVLEAIPQTSRLFGTRGINGIDGILSSAFGMTAASKECWNGLIIGDLSFFHSLNGLALGKKESLPLTIFVINNDGGGIFSMLPQGQLPKETFEPLFGTPQSLNIEALAQGFSCDYHKIQSLSEWKCLLPKIMGEPKLRIVEILTNREEETAKRKEINQLISSKLTVDILC